MNIILTSSYLFFKAMQCYKGENVKILNLIEWHPLIAINTKSFQRAKVKEDNSYNLWRNLTFLFCFVFVGLLKSKIRYFNFFLSQWNWTASVEKKKKNENKHTPQRMKKSRYLQPKHKDLLKIKWACMMKKLPQN